MDPMNEYIRRRAGRQAAPPDRAAMVERELAEARVALDVANGEPVSGARVRHGLATTSDWGGGPRGSISYPREESMSSIIREIVLRKKGARDA